MVEWSVEIASDMNAVPGYGFVILKIVSIAPTSASGCPRDGREKILVSGLLCSKIFCLNLCHRYIPLKVMACLK
jgi:hypothetical protein